MLELVIAGMMSCNLAGQTILENGDRQCRYRCQDKSLEYATTNPEYQCPRVLHVDKPKKQKTN